MKKYLLIICLSLSSKFSFSQTMDMVMYFTPDYGGSTGRLDWQMCGFMSITMLFDGTSYVSMADPVFTNISAGTHTFSFTGSDAIGNIYYFTANLDASPASPSIVLTTSFPSPPLCVIYTYVSASSLCDGMAVATCSYGVPPYSIQWYDGGGFLIGGATNDTLSSLCPGSVGLKVSDTYNVGTCMSTFSPIMRTVSSISCNITPTPVSCYGICDGSAIMFTPSFPSPLTTSLTGPTQLGGTFISGECAGPLAGFYMDVTGGSSYCFETILSPPILALNVDSIINASTGMNNGSLYVSLSDGSTIGSVSYTSVDTSGIISGSPLTGLPAGDYLITVTNVSGCSVSDSVTIGVASGINEIAISGMNVYPNPFSNKIQIQAFNLNQLKIFNLGGEIVYSQSNNISSEIDLSLLVDGTYLIVGTNSLGQKFRKPIIKIAGK